MITDDDRPPAPSDDLLDRVRAAPRDGGRVELVVRRPSPGEREVLDVGELDDALGLHGDRWMLGRSDGRPADPRAQVTIMGVRAAELACGPRHRWALAGDQLFVDLDLSPASLPPGTRLAIGSAVVEVTDKPHRGCAKFADRFGQAALDLVNSDEGVALNLRGVNARIVQSGVVRPGDVVRRLEG